MSEAFYTKEGRSLRLEIESGATHGIALQERGQAVERDGSFESMTLPGPPDVDRSAVAQIPSQLLQLITDMSILERATVVSGAARHELESDGRIVSWNDTSVRVHASIVNIKAGIRCEFERGDRVFHDQWITDLREMRDAVASCRADLVVAAPVCLEPPVSAAIIAAVWATGHHSSPALVQMPRAEDRDGYGKRIVERRIMDDSVSDTWFRPSYRIAPRPLPHDLDLAGKSTGGDLPPTRAIALTGSPELDLNVLRVPCLVQTEDGAVAATLEIDLTRWNEQIEIASGREEWFPLLAGVWGRRLLFKGEVSNGAGPAPTIL